MRWGRAAGAAAVLGALAVRVQGFAVTAPNECEDLYEASYAGMLPMEICREHCINSWDCQMSMLLCGKWCMLMKHCNSLAKLDWCPNSQLWIPWTIQEGFAVGCSKSNGFQAECCKVEDLCIDSDPNLLCYGKAMSAGKVKAESFKLAGDDMLTITDASGVTANYTAANPFPAAGLDFTVDTHILWHPTGANSSGSFRLCIELDEGPLQFTGPDPPPPPGTALTWYPTGTPTGSPNDSTTLPPTVNGTNDSISLPSEPPSAPEWDQICTQDCSPFDRNPYVALSGRDVPAPLPTPPPLPRLRPPPSIPPMPRANFSRIQWKTSGAMMDPDTTISDLHFGWDGQICSRMDAVGQLLPRGDTWINVRQDGVIGQIWSIQGDQKVPEIKSVSLTKDKDSSATKDGLAVVAMAVESGVMVGLTLNGGVAPQAWSLDTRKHISLPEKYQQYTGISRVIPNDRSFVFLAPGRIVDVWGDTGYGAPLPQRIADLRNVAAVAATCCAFVAITSDGVLAGAWGSRYFGGLLPEKYRGQGGCAQVASTQKAFAALRFDGKMIGAWGHAQSGGVLPDEMAAATGIALLSAAHRGAFAALGFDGRLRGAWGNASHGGVIPAEYMKLTNIADMASTVAAFALLCADGSLCGAWGDPELGGEFPAEASALPVRISKLVGSGQGFAALSENGTIPIAWGTNETGNLTDAVRAAQNISELYGSPHLLGGFAAVKPTGTIMVSWPTPLPQDKNELWKAHAEPCETPEFYGDGIDPGDCACAPPGKVCHMKCKSGYQGLNRWQWDDFGMSSVQMKCAESGTIQGIKLVQAKENGTVVGPITCERPPCGGPIGGSPAKNGTWQTGVKSINWTQCENLLPGENCHIDVVCEELYGQVLLPVPESPENFTLDCDENRQFTPPDGICIPNPCWDGPKYGRDPRASKLGYGHCTRNLRSGERCMHTCAQLGWTPQNSTHRIKATFLLECKREIVGKSATGVGNSGKVAYFYNASGAWCVRKWNASGYRTISPTYVVGFGPDSENSTYPVEIHPPLEVELIGGPNNYEERIPIPKRTTCEICDCARRPASQYMTNCTGCLALGKTEAVWNERFRGDCSNLTLENAKFNYTELNLHWIPDIRLHIRQVLDRPLNGTDIHYYGQVKDYWKEIMIRPCVDRSYLARIHPNGTAFCLKCPWEGLQCEGQARSGIANGTWRPDRAILAVGECVTPHCNATRVQNSQGHLLETWEPNCLDGGTGVLCGECEEGYRFNDGVCQKCGDLENYRRQVFWGLVIVLSVGSIYIFANCIVWIEDTAFRDAMHVCVAHLHFLTLLPARVGPIWEEFPVYGIIYDKVRALVCPYREVLEVQCLLPPDWGHREVQWTAWLSVWVLPSVIAAFWAVVLPPILRLRIRFKVENLELERASRPEDPWEPDYPLSGQCADCKGDIRTGHCRCHFRTLCKCGTEYIKFRCKKCNSDWCCRRCILSHRNVGHELQLRRVSKPGPRLMTRWDIFVLVHNLMTHYFFFHAMSVLLSSFIWVSYPQRTDGTRDWTWQYAAWVDHRIEMSAGYILLSLFLFFSVLVPPGFLCWRLWRVCKKAPESLDEHHNYVAYGPFYTMYRLERCWMGFYSFFLRSCSAALYGIVVNHARRAFLGTCLLAFGWAAELHHHPHRRITAVVAAMFGVFSVCIAGLWLTLRTQLPTGLKVFVTHCSASICMLCHLILLLTLRKHMASAPYCLRWLSLDWTNRVWHVVKRTVFRLEMCASPGEIAKSSRVKPKPGELERLFAQCPPEDFLDMVQILARRWLTHQDLLVFNRRLKMFDVAGKRKRKVIRAWDKKYARRAERKEAKKERGEWTAADEAEPDMSDITEGMLEAEVTSSDSTPSGSDFEVEDIERLCATAAHPSDADPSAALKTPLLPPPEKSGQPLSPGFGSGFGASTSGLITPQASGLHQRQPSQPFGSQSRGRRGGGRGQPQRGAEASVESSPLVPAQRVVSTPAHPRPALPDPAEDADYEPLD
eukprot:TRINITY_DN64960_c0_g1_i1.p1 TRINITY_DN64960_c0_g1~~TRINITY_DN64960_c0_g1_i1.p1  ORF type:complete len:1993 (+),score=445.73 TRINITY_DN64960_c0_g1_i1:110-6088(+)